jgi:hypothetical protein
MPSLKRATTGNTGMTLQKLVPRCIYIYESLCCFCWSLLAGSVRVKRQSFNWQNCQLSEASLVVSQQTPSLATHFALYVALLFAQVQLTTIKFPPIFLGVFYHVPIPYTSFVLNMSCLVTTSTAAFPFFCWFVEFDHVWTTHGVLSILRLNCVHFRLHSSLCSSGVYFRPSPRLSTSQLSVFISFLRTPVFCAFLLNITFNVIILTPWLSTERPTLVGEVNANCG